MTYKVVSRIKTGSKDDGFEYLERGDSVSASGLDLSKEEFEELVAAEVVMDAKEFDARFPELEEGENQPTGTPSNLEEIEGTKLQAAQPEAPEEETEPVHNPADPPEVKGATPAGEKHK